MIKRYLYFIPIIQFVQLACFSNAWGVSETNSLMENNKPVNSLPLTLSNAIRITLKNNVGIAFQEYFSKIREQEIVDQESKFDPSLSAEISSNQRDSQVASAFAFPNISENRNQNWEFSITQKLLTGADYKIQFKNNRNRTNSAFAGLNPQFNSDLSLSLTQPLLKNFGIGVNKSNIFIANNNKDISDYEFQDKVIKTLSEVENSYWNLVLSIKDLKVKEKSLERAQDLESRVIAQVDVGTMAPIDILQAKSEVASREQLLVSGNDLIKDNEDLLKNSMNISFRNFNDNLSIHPKDEPHFIKAVTVKTEDAINTALKKRPDYLAKKKGLENKNIKMKFNDNQTYPTLDMFATMGLNGIAGTAQSLDQFGTGSTRSEFDGRYPDALGYLFDSEFYNFEVGVRLTYPFGNRSAKSKLTASRLELQQAIMEIKTLERKIIVEVREAVRQMKTDIKRVEASRLARKLAEEKLKAEEKKFIVGMSTSFNVLEFQEDLAREQSNEIKSIIDYNKSKIKLNQVIGRTLEHHHIQLAKSMPGQ